MVNEKNSRVFGGTMLIAGTSIGAAMLAMPILTGLFGFLGTTVIMIACWLFMYWTATLILEASLQFKEGTSFIGMARSTLGPIGAFVTWLTFLLLFYSLVSAYLSGSGRIILDALESFLRIELPPFFDIFPLLVIFAPFIYFGLGIVDQLNRYLMLGMLLSYLAIVIWMAIDIDLSKLLYIDTKYSMLSFSVVVTSFGYHVIIPTLVTYLDRDIKKIKQSMFYGSFIPLIIYLFWEAIILGSLSIEGGHGLLQAFENDLPLSRLLRFQLNSDFISALSQSFSIFAIVTSFLGVAQGLFDFLLDGINAGTSHKKRSFAFLLTFAPPVLMIILFQSGFLVLLDYAGALVSIILGIIPIVIVWKLRSTRKDKFEYQARGGIFSLILGIVFFSFVVTLVLIKNFSA